MMKSLFLLVLSVSTAHAGAPGRAYQVLLEKCAGCHAGNAPLSKFYGDLTDHSNLLESYVVPGNIKKSFLWDRIARGEMPPSKDNALTAEEKNAIKEWIETGASEW